MKIYTKSAYLAPVLLFLLTTSCGKKEVETPTPAAEESAYTGEKAVEVREETIIELLAIKKGVKQSILEHRKAESMDTFVNDLESYRPRIEYIHMQTKMLPKSEQMVVQGNLAVVTNQLEKELLAMLAKAPGNDDLALEIANLRANLSPIPLGSVLRRF